MRILHTSDWHLGISHGVVRRDEDHDHFLRWLLDEIEARQIDALIIAGDVFDVMHPSAEAQRRYFGFLAQLAATDLPQVVVIGGNHDSATRLQAPSEALRALRAHVVGGIGADEATWERCVVPLRDRAGEIRAVALAVPYVHEFRLGVRTTDLDHQAIRRAFTERFGALYRGLADLAEARWPGLPLVGTGHLTLGEADSSDYPQEIHQVGTIDGLSTQILDPRMQYVALGHIHRCYPVDKDRRAWYSGSPLAMSLPEQASPRRVLDVTLSADPRGEPTIEKVEVPAPRALIEIRGTPDEVLRRTYGLKWSEPLPPLLFYRVLTDTMPTELLEKLNKVLDKSPSDKRPTLIELRQERLTPIPRLEEELPLSLRELEPIQVFSTLCQSQGRADTDELERAFQTLVSARDEDLEERIAEITGERP
ncbi:MAG: exonuclease subunit SbcD [Deltaproteobacteria bacterium]|nr:MAG: exonuclease subunit SbcD [Deltaproteobacteria bacterium]